VEIRVNLRRRQPLSAQPVGEAAKALYQARFPWPRWRVVIDRRWRAAWASPVAETARCPGCSIFPNPQIEGESFPNFVLKIRENVPSCRFLIEAGKPNALT